MRSLALSLAAATLLAGGSAMAASPFTSPPGKDPKVCLLTFASAGEFGRDLSVVKAQFVPLQIATKLLRDETTQGIGYYGFGELTAEQEAQVDFYYPEGSLDPDIGVPENSDTETLCLAFMDHAAGQDDDDDE